MLTFYRQSMDGSIYRRSDAGAWEALHPDGSWAPLPVPLSQQDYEHLVEIDESAAVVPATAAAGLPSVRGTELSTDVDAPPPTRLRR